MSSIKIGKRVSKTEDNPYGFEYVDSIPYDEPCVVYIGGDGTTNGKAANGYAKGIQNDVLNPINIDVPVYSIEFDFSNHNKSRARRLSFLKHRTALLDNPQDKKIKEKATEEDYNPQYINELFEKIILSRISKVNGKGRLSVEEAGRRIRMLNIVVHCNGAYAALSLEEKMQSKMSELGYNSDERKQIQSQMLVVAHAPACALGVSKSQFISFGSTYDMSVPSGNSAVEVLIRQAQTEERRRFAAEQDKNEKGIAENKWFDFKPCYFKTKNYFLIKQKYEWNTSEGPFLINENEHNNVSYNDRSQTKEGRILQYFSKTILQNAVKNSLDNQERFTPLPSIDRLILSGDKVKDARVTDVFANMSENGRNFRTHVCKELIASRAAITAKNQSIY